MVAQTGRVRNRLHAFLTQISPTVERALGPRLDPVEVITLLTRYPLTGSVETARRGHVQALLTKHAPRLAERLTEEIFTALTEQTVTVTTSEEKIIGRLAD